MKSDQGKKNEKVAPSQTRRKNATEAIQCGLEVTEAKQGVIGPQNLLIKGRLVRHP
jgi:hypothetical protein